MRGHHYLGIFLLLVLGYFIGINYPGPGSMVISKIRG